METPEIDWDPFYRAVQNAGPSETLTAWLAVTAQTPGKAADLGCGEGRDALKLLELGWQVVAVDPVHAAVSALLQKATERQLDSGLTVVQSKIEEADWGQVDYVNANLVLPYCPPETFSQVWQKISDSLVTGGCLAGQLFGNEHSYAAYDWVSVFTRAEVDALLQPFDILKCDERKLTAQNGAGQPVTSHQFDIIVRKR
jgi:SAM-dependent methyltransferase